MVECYRQSGTLYLRRTDSLNNIDERNYELMFEKLPNQLNENEQREIYYSPAYVIDVAVVEVESTMTKWNNLKSYK